MGQYTILVVEAIKGSVVRSAEKLRGEHPELGEPQLVLLTTKPQKYGQYAEQGVTIVECDFEPAAMRCVLDGLAPIKAVLCRGDVHIQYLRKLVPLLPPDVLVSSADALQVATNKRLMRAAFARHCPAATPKFVQVTTAGSDDAAADLTFPVIVKPTGLASSLLIQRCDSPEELRLALHATFEKLAETYAHEGRTDAPEVIVEEYLEGDFYSVDSYVLEPGEVYHLPLIHYVPAKQLGINDFFLYKRTAPVTLAEQEIAAAERVATEAIAAAGLTHSTVHIELVHTTAGDWKIIEIGPRLGRFRNIMYREAFGVDHSYNDLLVHLGFKPDMELRRSVPCAAYSIYPDHEGTLHELVGVAGIKAAIPGVVYAADMSEPHMPVRFARNGGHALYEIIFTAPTPAEFEKACAWMEANVRADVM